MDKVVCEQRGSTANVDHGGLGRHAQRFDQLQ